MTEIVPFPTLPNMLAQLRGLRVWGPGIAAGTLMLQFGEKMTRIDHRGEVGEVGQWALHVQSAWRVLHGDRVVAGFEDYLHDEVEEEEPCPWFERLKECLASGPRVLKIRIGRAQSFGLELEGGLLIECFRSASCGDDSVEAWRMFRPSRQEPHFVVGPNGYGLDT